MPTGSVRRAAAIALLTAAAAWAGDGAEPNQLVGEAAGEFTKFHFVRAHQLFEQARRLAPKGSEAWIRATYGQAIAAHQRTPAAPEYIAEAKALYEELAASGDRSAFTARAVLNLGRIAEVVDFFRDPVDLPGARQRYQQVIDGWGDQPIAGEAALRLAGTWIQTLAPDDRRRGCELLEAWVQAHPADPLASTMLQYLSDTYLAMGQPERSVQRLVQADAIGLNAPNSEGALWWRIARLSESDAPNRELAVRYYTRIITDAPISGKAWEAQQALARLGAPVPPIGRVGTQGAAR